MNDVPYSPGGFIEPVGPVLGWVRPGEPVMSLQAAREWLASGLGLEDWLEQCRDRQGGADGDAG